MALHFPLHRRSSVIKRIAYDPDSCDLYIEFRGKAAVWQYAGVPQETYRALLGAGSLGSFFSKQIRHSFSDTQQDQDWWRREAEAAAALDFTSSTQPLIDDLRRNDRAVCF